MGKRWLFVQDNCPMCTAPIIHVPQPPQQFDQVAPHNQQQQGYEEMQQQQQLARPNSTPTNTEEEPNEGSFDGGVSQALSSLPVADTGDIRCNENVTLAPDHRKHSSDVSA